MSDLTSDFNFSDEPVKFGPFPIGSRSFILHEATEAAYTAFHNIITRSVKRGNDSKVLYQDGVQEADAALIQRCLYEIVGVKETPVTLTFVEELTRRVSSKLYSKIREISGMDDEAETIEFLEKRIESDKKKLADLNEGKDTAAKNV